MTGTGITFCVKEYRTTFCQWLQEKLGVSDFRTKFLSFLFDGYIYMISSVPEYRNKSSVSVSGNRVWPGVRDR
jgi:hypothetical protein